MKYRFTIFMMFVCLLATLTGLYPLSRKILSYQHRQHHFLNDLSQLIQKRTE